MERERWQQIDQLLQSVLEREPAERAASPLPCGLRPPEQIAELVRMVLGNAESRKRLTQVRTDLIERHCVGCHSGFDIKPAMTATQKDEAALRFMLAQDAWVYPGMPDDLIKEIKLLAVHEGKKLKDAVAELLRQGLSAASGRSATVVKADKAMLKRRKALTQKFVTGEWGVELDGFEAARKADRLAAAEQAKAWRD